MGDTRSIPRERWSRPVGIVSLCLSVIFALLTGAIIPETLQNMRQYGTSWGTGLLVEDAFILTAQVFLFIGAVLLLRRRPLAWEFHIVYASILLPLGLWDSIREGLNSYRTSVVLQHDYVAFAGTLLVIALLALAYPVFVLIWFFRSKVREDVKSWRDKDNRAT